MNSQRWNLFALWLFNPFISLIYSIRGYKENKQFPWILTSFYFGICFIHSFGQTDSTRYAQELYQLNHYPISFLEMIGQCYSQDGDTDIYQLIVTWCLAVFTDNSKWLFGVFSLVFGYFWFKSFEIIKSKANIPNATFLSWLVLILVLLINPIWSINGVRMWTAMQIFIYGVILIEFEKKKSGYFFIFLPLLVHFSLVLLLVWYILYKLLPLKGTTILFTAYCLSFFLGELKLSSLQSLFESVPGFLQSKKSYISEEYAEGLKEVKENAWHVLLAEILRKYLIFSLVIYIYFKAVIQKSFKDLIFIRFFKMTLFFGLFTNLAASVPSGLRFMIFTETLCLIAVILFLASKKFVVAPFFNVIFTSVFIYLIIFQIRAGLDFVGVFYFLGNPLIMLFFNDTIPVIEYIKGIF